MVGDGNRPDAVRHEVNVPAEPADAFRSFTADLGEWWPPEFTWSQNTLEDIGMDCEEGGACFEIGPHGFRCDWGRVIQWDPPERVVLTWQISPERQPEPDPAKSSEVVVRFRPADNGSSQVVLEHAGFQRHGDRADEYRAGMEKGWGYLLDRYAAAVRSRKR